ncbi:MAG: alpha/beta hydrolase-fold protein [Bacteroidales bacterium]
MKKQQLLTVIFLGLIASSSLAQVTFIIDQVPAYTPVQDSLYIAGDFNGWNPGDTEYVLHKNEQSKWEITLAAQPDLTSISFKFTRGSWATVEKGASGEEIPNRAFTYGNGDVVHIIIYNWADNGGGGSTAATNVIVMSTDFFIPQLNRNRRIWLYFPPDYETSGLNYPVLYMHDGQNLFDAFTSFAGEWEVDETLNSLATQGYQVPMVVGIDNGGTDRIGEYTPWLNSQYGGGDGEKYMQFIVETLKPYIDEHYRTLPGRGNTALMGSSLGGLISHYGSLAYQDVFSKTGLFSPSYWFSDSIWAFTRQTGKQENMKFYQLCGSLEGSEMTNGMQRMNDSLKSIGFPQNDIFNKVIAGGQHNEQLWRETFGEAYLWLFNDYATAIEELEVNGKIIIYPNPVNDIITLRDTGNNVYDSIVIIDSKGQEVKSFFQNKNNAIDIGSLEAGNYLLKCTKGDILHSAKFIKK